MLKLIILEGFKVLWQKEVFSSSPHPALWKRKMMTIGQEKDNLQEHGNARLFN